MPDYGLWGAVEQKTGLRMTVGKRLRNENSEEQFVALELSPLVKIVHSQEHRT